MDTQPSQSQKQATISQLSKKISFQEAKLKMTPNDPTAQNLMGKYFSDMAKLTGSPKDYQKALTYLDKAIDLDSTNTVYFCDRAKLHAFFKQTKRAVRDFQKISQLSKNQSSGILDDYYVLHTLKDLARLQEVKATIQSLRERNLLPSDFLNAFDTLRDVTEGLVVAQEKQSKQLTELFATIELVKNKLENLTEKDMAEVNRVLKKYDQEIKEHGAKLAEHDEILDWSGARDIATLKQHFEMLKRKDLILYTYATTFYWATINLFGAYRHLSTGMISSDGDSGVESAILVDTVKNIASVGNDLMKSLPVVGGVIKFTDSIIDKVVGWVKGKQLEEKCSIIAQIIKKNCRLEDELSLLAGKISLVLVANEAKVLALKRDPTKAPPKNSLIGWIVAKCDKKKAEWWPNIRKELPVIEAIQDVSMLFAYMLLNNKKILEDETPLDIQVERILKEDKLNNMLVGIGLNGVCNRCQGTFVPRSGKKTGMCTGCKKSTKGGLKCGPCNFKYCDVCSQSL